MTTVIDNLQGLETLSRAQSWLTDKLSSVDGPSHKSIYGKGGFPGTIFAEFTSHEDRDLAVALVRSAGINQGGNSIWVAQDKAPVERVAHNFCFGLENLFKMKKSDALVARATTGMKGSGKSSAGRE